MQSVPHGFFARISPTPAKVTASALLERTRVRSGCGLRLQLYAFVTQRQQVQGPTAYIAAAEGRPSLTLVGVSCIRFEELYCCHLDQRPELRCSKILTVCTCRIPDSMLWQMLRHARCQSLGSVPLTVALVWSDTACAALNDLGNESVQAARLSEAARLRILWRHLWQASSFPQPLPQQMLSENESG